jgi:hypothetical protein
MNAQIMESIVVFALVVTVAILVSERRDDTDKDK